MPSACGLKEIVKTMQQMSENITVSTGALCCPAKQCRHMMRDCLNSRERCYWRRQEIAHASEQAAQKGKGANKMLLRE